MARNIPFNTFLAVVALAAAQQETAHGITNLDPLEIAAMKASDYDFRTEAADHWLDADAEFEAFMHTLDTQDVEFLATAIA